MKLSQTAKAGWQNWQSSSAWIPHSEQSLLRSCLYRYEAGRSLRHPHGKCARPLLLSCMTSLSDKRPKQTGWKGIFDQACVKDLPVRQSPLALILKSLDVSPSTPVSIAFPDKTETEIQGLIRHL